MSEETVFTNNDSVVRESKGDEGSLEIGILEKKIRELTKENDEYKQENYHLRRKLEMEQKLNREITEDNEVSLKQLESRLQREIKEITEKYSADREKNSTYIQELELTLSDKQKEINSLNEYIEHMKTEMMNNDNKNSTIPMELCDNEKIFFLEQEIRVLSLRAEFEAEKNEKLNENLAAMTADMKHLMEMLNVSKENAAEKSELLETVREELILCQSELNALKSVPDTNSSKGNSVFAELEDSRNKVVKQMNVLKSSYQEMKQNYKVLEYENIRLKSEKAKLLNEWCEESCAILGQHKTIESTYNDTILKLQSNLESERTKYNALMSQQLQNANISFLQIQLAERKKEIDKLQSQIECDYYQKFVQQQQVDKLLKEIRFWKYKTLSNTESRDIDTSRITDFKSELADDEMGGENKQVIKKARVESDDDGVKSSALFEKKNVPCKSVKFAECDEISDKENATVIVNESISTSHENVPNEQNKVSVQCTEKTSGIKTEVIKPKSETQTKYQTLYIPSVNK